MGRYYTIKEVAKLLEESRLTIRRLIYYGWIKAKRTGVRRKLMIHERDLFMYAYRRADYSERLDFKIGQRFSHYKISQDTLAACQNSL